MKNIINKRDIIIIEISKHPELWWHNSENDTFYTEMETAGNKYLVGVSFHSPVYTEWLKMSIQRHKDGKTMHNPMFNSNIAFVFHEHYNGSEKPNTKIDDEILGIARDIFGHNGEFNIYSFEFNLDTMSIDDIKFVMNIFS